MFIDKVEIVFYLNKFFMVLYFINYSYDFLTRVGYAFKQP